MGVVVGTIQPMSAVDILKRLHNKTESELFVERYILRRWHAAVTRSDWMQIVYILHGALLVTPDVAVSNDYFFLSCIANTHMSEASDE